MIDGARSDTLDNRSGRGRWLGVACVAVLAMDVAGARAEPSVAHAPPMSPAPVAAPEAPAPLPGQLSSRFRVNPRNPEEDVPGLKERNAAPLEFGYYLQDLVAMGDAARKDHDYESWIRFYRAIAKAVPDRATAWSKLCEAYELTGDPERAIRACRYAIDRPGVQLQDYQRYLKLMVGKVGPISADDRKEVDAVIKHMEGQRATLPTGQSTFDVMLNQMRCEVGVKAKDVSVLQACTEALAKVAPDDAKTVVFQWVLAMEKGQHTEAQRLLGRAEKAGIVMDKVQRMRDVTDSLSGGSTRRTLKVALFCGVGLLLAAAIVLAVRRRTTAARLAR